MIEILEFVFSSFWHWLGFVILVSAIADIPRGLIKVVIRRAIKKVEEKKQ